MSETEGGLPNSFYDASITLILKSCKDTTTATKNYKPISLINTDANTPNKILRNCIYTSKKITHNDYIGFI